MYEYQAARELDRYLGDPFQPNCTFNFGRIVECDEADEFPSEQVAEVRQWGFGHYLVPEAYGGRFTSFEQMAGLTRVVSRRDLTVSIAYGATLLGALPVWLHGSEQQKTTLAESICGGDFGAIGLTEETHGSDLLSCEFAAVRDADTLSLTGEKWLINNGTQGRWITVLARTNRAGGPLGFSFVHVRKSQLDPARYEHLAKIRTLGIRGADMSGIRFDNCPVPADALVGELGDGMSSVLKTLQLTRTFFGAFSLGAGDTALRIAMKFALSRQLYGASVFSIPTARDQLIGVYLDLLIAECLTYSACRGIHVCTEQMSVWSAVVKYLVPTLMEDAVYQAALVFGARYYLRQHFAAGMFQKIFRDNILIGLFDGSTAVNLYVIASQLKELARRRAANGSAERPQAMLDRQAMFDWSQPLPVLDPARLVLGNVGRDDVVNGLPAAARQWREWTSGLPVSPWEINQIQRCLDGLVAELHNADQELQALNLGGTQGYKSTAAFHLSRKHCWLHAASACVYTWLMNQHHAGEFLASATWLALGLDRILRRLQGRPVEIPEEHADSVTADMLCKLEEGVHFSLLPLAASDASPTVELISQ